MPDVIILSKASPIFEENPHCMYCHTALRPGDSVVRCPTCGAAHHEQCWREGGDHCAALGCIGSGSIDWQQPKVEMRTAQKGRETVAPSGQPMVQSQIFSSALNIDQVVARSKSYTGLAVLVLFLYLTLILWPMGFILNWVYRREAERAASVAGQALSGQGFLGIMFWLNVALILLVVGVVVVLIVPLVVLIATEPGVSDELLQKLNQMF